ncbi:MAG: hypothetical protein PF447_10505 [Spirochaetaceae bacterium]|jgi:hypothetical protein|nr:hypothetical protein [Spirochaetaceae bacterium]
MKHNKALVLLSLFIIVLSTIAAVAGLWPGHGSTTTVESLWGETWQLEGQGLYQNDTHSLAVQAQAQDWITLCLGIPLLIISLIFYRHGSYRGRLLLTGTLGYFLYTYMSASFLLNYNMFFLVYVALCSLTHFAIIIAFKELDIPNITEKIGDKFPRVSLAIFDLTVAFLLLLLWMGRILPSLIQGGPPEGLEIYTTLVIQAMDLAIIVPVAIIAGIGLLRRKALGFGLSIVIALKGMTLFAAVSLMALMGYREGTSSNPIELWFFLGATAANWVFILLILKNVKVKKADSTKTVS